MVKIVLAVLFGALALGNVRPAGAQEGIASGLRLTGVLVSGQASVAIIAGADGREKVYRLGHEIHAGARLEEISAHGVMVVRDRRREWLPLVGGAAAAERKAGSAPQAQPVAELKPGAAVAASFGSSLPERRSKFSPELAKEGAITPAPGGGLQLNEVAPEGAYAAIGLRPGDVLRSVNGNPVGSGKELGALVRQVSSGQHGYVEVLRNGEVNVLRFGHAP